MSNSNISFRKVASPSSQNLAINMAQLSDDELKQLFINAHAELTKRGFEPVVAGGALPSQPQPTQIPKGFVYSDRTGKTYKVRAAKPKPAALSKAERDFKVAEGNLKNYLKTFSVNIDKEKHLYTIRDASAEHKARLESFNRTFALSLLRLRQARGGTVKPVTLWRVEGNNGPPSSVLTAQMMGSKAKPFGDALSHGEILHAASFTSELEGKEEEELTDSNSTNL